MRGKRTSLVCALLVVGMLAVLPSWSTAEQLVPGEIVDLQALSSSAATATNQAQKGWGMAAGYLVAFGCLIKASLAERGKGTWLSGAGLSGIGTAYLSSLTKQSFTAVASAPLGSVIHRAAAWYNPLAWVEDPVFLLICVVVVASLCAHQGRRVLVTA